MSAVPKIGTASRPSPKTPRAPKAEVMSILDRMSIDPAISDDRVRARMAYEDGVRKDTARRAYDQAMTEMQPKLPVIEENGKIKDRDGKVRHTYAEWEDIAEAIRPILAESGFNLTFRCQPGPGQVEVTAVCAHDGGHREEATVPQIVDQSDGKNANQGMKSATSYGKRAAATLLLNITTRGEDDDAVTSTGDGGEPRITAEQVAEIRTALTNAGRKEARFLTMIGALTLEDVRASRYAETLAAVSAAGNGTLNGASR